MKKLILVVIAIAFCSNLFAQKNGMYGSKYENGQTKIIGEYKNDVKIGIWKHFYESGTLEEEGAYDERGDYTGKWKKYFENGQLKSVGEYVAVNGWKKQNGIWKSYYENGQLKNIGEYKADKYIGIWKEYSMDGVLKVKSNFNSHITKSYYDSGELETILDGNHNVEVYLFNPRNSFSGSVKQFHKNGKVKLECEFVDNYLILRSYFDNGQLKSIKYIRKKPQNEVEKQIIENRPSAIDEITIKYYEYGRFKIGIWKEYDRDGTLISEEDFAPLK